MIGILEIYFKDGSIRKVKNFLCNRFAYSSNNLTLGATNNQIQCEATFTPDASVLLTLTNISQTTDDTATLSFTAQFSNPNLFADYSNIGIYDNDLQEWLSIVSPSFPLENIDHINYYIHVPYSTSNLYLKKLLQLWKKDTTFKVINLYDTTFALSDTKNINFWDILDTTYIQEFSPNPTVRLLHAIITPDFTSSTLNGTLFLTDNTITLTQKPAFTPSSNFHYFLSKMIPTTYSLFSDFTTLSPSPNTTNAMLEGQMDGEIYSLEVPFPNLPHFILISRILSPYTDPKLPDESTQIIYFIKPYNQMWENDNTKNIIPTDIQLSTTPSTTIQKYYQQSDRQWVDNTQLYRSHPLWNEILYEHENLKFAVLTSDGLFIVYNNNSYEVKDIDLTTSLTVDGSVVGTIVGLDDMYIFSEDESNFHVYTWSYDWNTDHILIQEITSITKDYGEILNEPYKVIHAKDYDGTVVVYVFNNNRQLYKLDTSTLTWTGLPYYITQNTYPYITDQIFAFFNSPSSDLSSIQSLIAFFDTYPEIEYSFTNNYTPTIPPYINSIQLNNTNYGITFYNENEQNLYLLIFNAFSTSEYWTKTYSITDQIIFYPTPTHTLPLLLPTSSGLFYIFAPAFTIYYKEAWNYVVKDETLFWDETPNITDYSGEPYPPLPQDKNAKFSYFENYFINNDMLFYIITNPSSFLYNDNTNLIDNYTLFSLGTRKKDNIDNFSITIDSTIPYTSEYINLFRIKNITSGEGFVNLPIIYYASETPPPIKNPNTFYVQIIPPYHFLYTNEEREIDNYPYPISFEVYWLLRGRQEEEENIVGNNIFPIYSEPDYVAKYNAVVVLNPLLFIKSPLLPTITYTYIFSTPPLNVNTTNAYIFVN